jgi:uncharacterized protein
VKLISASRYLTMPWKNGLGQTAQIAIEPASARFPQDPFLWRISSATVTANNEFSLFPGYDRILSIWQGEGLILNGQLLTPNSARHFPGEDEVFCEIVGSTVVDIGVIFDREKIEADLTEIVLKRPQVLSLLKGSYCFFCKQGEFEIDDCVVKTGDSLLLNGPKEVEIRPLNVASLLMFSMKQK